MKPKAKMGRPTKPIDWNIVGALISMRNTQDEISAAISISVDTLTRRCKEDTGLSFAEFYAQNLGKGNVSLRRALWDKAVTEKDGQTLRWLAINYLGHTNRVENTGTTTVVNEFANVSTKELEARLDQLMKQIKAS